MTVQNLTVPTACTAIRTAQPIEADIHPGGAQHAGRLSASATLITIARTYPERLAGTLSLVALENALLLIYPLFAGFAVDCIVRGDVYRATSYAAVVLAFWIVGAARRALDTRTFTRIYADLAVGVVLDQRNRRKPTSVTAGRVGLAREFVDFFEIHLPAMATAIVSMFGAALMLLFLAPAVGLAAVTGLVACLLWLPGFSRRNQRLHARLNDRIEGEVRLVKRGSRPALARHFSLMSKLRIGLSDREAFAFLFIGGLATALFAIAVAHLALSQGVKAGQVYAVMTYLWTFVTSLDEAPVMVDRMVKLKDIGRRVAPSFGQAG